jgi:hypothetical protein
VLQLVVLTTILLYRRHKRRRIQRMRRAFSASKGYSDSAPAPTFESIHQNQPWMMTTTPDAIPDVPLHDVPLDDDDEDIDVSDHHSTACSFSPSDDTPTINNVKYHHGVVLQSLQYKSRSGRRIASNANYDDDFDHNSASALGRSHPFVTIT